MLGVVYIPAQVLVYAEIPRNYLPEIKGSQVLSITRATKKILSDAGQPLQLAQVTSGRKNPLWCKLPDRLKNARENRGLNSTEIGRRAGIGHQTTTRIERGERTPQIDTVELIARALQVEPCWLAFGFDGGKPFNLKSKVTKPETDVPDIATSELTSAYLGVAKRLSDRRSALGLSLRQVGTAAGISYQTVNLIECGEAVPKVDSLHRLAIALDVAPCWLAYGVGDPPIDPAEAGLQRGTQSEPTEGAKA